jgi:modulator of FtsH protease HflC
VIAIDKRILDLENPAQEVFASDQKRLVVDAFARYRIVDPLKFYQSVGSVEGANSRLSSLLNSALRRVLAEATLIQVVKDQREQLMARVREQLDGEAKAFGITVVDVRIRRADLPAENSQAVFQRMQTQRQRIAQQFRSLGIQEAQEIRAKSDRDVTVLLAEAQSKGEQPAARAMPRAIEFSPKPLGRIPNSSRSTARCKPTKRACAPMTRACCSSPIRISFATSAIPPASPATVPHPPAGPPVLERRCPRAHLRGSNRASPSRLR